MSEQAGRQAVFRLAAKPGGGQGLRGGSSCRGGRATDGVPAGRQAKKQQQRELDGCCQSRRGEFAESAFLACMRIALRLPGMVTIRF